MTKSKRLKITMVVFVIYIIIGCAAYCINAQYIGAFGGYMAATSLPVLGYLFGETYRKSE